jgi:hypothetical protein
MNPGKKFMAKQMHKQQKYGRSEKLTSASSLGEPDTMFPPGRGKTQ